MPLLNVTMPEKLPGQEAVIESARALFGPVGNELAQLFADRVRFWRWRSAVRIINRARRIREQEGISDAQPSLKFFFPFIEEASKENENDDICEWWARLLSKSDGSTAGFDIHCIQILSSIGSTEARLLELGAQMSNASRQQPLLDDDHDPEYKINIVDELIDIAQRSKKSSPLLENHLARFRKLYALKLQVGPLLTLETSIYRENLGTVLVLDKLGLIKREHLLLFAPDFRNLFDIYTHERRMRGIGGPSSAVFVEAEIWVPSLLGRALLDRCSGSQPK